MVAILNFLSEIYLNKEKILLIRRININNFFQSIFNSFSWRLFKNHILLNYIEKYYLKTRYSRNLQNFKAPYSQKAQSKTHSQPLVGMFWYIFQIV